MSRIDLLLTLMALIWAVNFSILKYGTRLIAPLAYNAVRIPVAAVLQLVLARTMRAAPVSRKDAVTLVLLGTIGNGLYQVLFILGMARSRVATTVLILASGPALVAVMGRLRGDEEDLTHRAWWGIALQLVGVGCVVLGAGGGRAGRDSLLGGMLVLGAAMSWAYFSLLVKPMSERLPALQVGAYTMLGGAVVSVAVGLPALRSTTWPALPAGAYGALFYSTVGAMVIAYLIWYQGVKTIGPTRTSMYANLQPVLAMLVAWIALRELPTMWQVGGGVSITSGLLLARTASREPEAA
jgi:drug/metabolite transporter (DMT)-like permease